MSSNLHILDHKLCASVFDIFFFFGNPGCPGQLTRTTTNPRTHWTPCKPSRQVRHRAGVTGVHAEARTQVTEARKPLSLSLSLSLSISRVLQSIVLALLDTDTDLENKNKCLKVSENPHLSCQRRRPISHFSTVGSTWILGMLCDTIVPTSWPERSFIFKSTREILPFEDFWANHSWNSQNRWLTSPLSTVGSIWILDMWWVWLYYTFRTVEMRWNPSSKVFMHAQ